MGIKGLFNRIRYKEGKEYYIPISKISINPKWGRSRVGAKKWKAKYKYWSENGKFESTIILDYNFMLLDGYSSFCIAREQNLGTVPVIFSKGTR